MAVDLQEFEQTSVALAVDLLREFLAPPPRLSVTEWAEKNRWLSSTESAEPGRYRVSRTPYAQEPQDAMSARSTVEEVVLMWAAQTGKTNLMLNCIGASIDMQPGPMMIVWPTNTVAKRNSRQRIAPLLNESPVLASKVATNRSRDKANTTLLKEFDGGIIVIAGANSAADLRSTPVRDLYLDEIDNFPLDVDGEGDPSKLAEARQTTFSRKKRLRTSTPTTKDFSRIEAAYLASDRCRYHVPCPHCGSFQALEFGADKPHGLKWNKAEDGRPIPTTVRYVCAAHGCEIREHNKSTMLPRGVWVAEAPGAQGWKVRGFHLSGLYSPLGWLSWRTIADEWFNAMQAVARGDVSLLRVFVNTRLAETFEEQGDKADQHALRKRAGDDELGVVRWGLCVCTMGVDVQGDRIEAYIWAWGRGLERQLVDRRVFYGDPAQPEAVEGSPWAALTEYRRAGIAHASGSTLSLLACGIDTGGHHTQAVYTYARAHAHEKVLALKGSSQARRAIIGKPTEQDINWRGQRVRRGVKLWPVGTDTAKAEIYGRLRLERPGPGYVHLSRRLPGEVFDQLTAERLITRYVKGHPRMEWVKPAGRRNEALDCAVYALAGAMWLQLDRWRSADWTRWERRVVAQAPKAEEPQQEPKPVEAEPAQPTEAAPAEQAAKPPPGPRRRRRGSIGRRFE